MLADLIPINKKLYTYWDDTNDIINKNHSINMLLLEYQKIHPDYEIGLINKKEIKNFFYNRFPFLYNIFDRIKIYCIRSDLSRMAHLYIHGGFYCDSHIQILDKLENITLCDYSIGTNHKSFIATKECGTHLNDVCLQYSVGEDDLQLECLRIAEIKLQNIIEKENKYKAGQYKHDIHVACSNGMYAYLDINGNIINPNINKNYIFNLFGHICPNGGDPNIFKKYSSIIMTSNLTRANNKHWSILCDEIDLI